MAATQDDLIATLQRANAEVRRERDAALASRDSRYGELAAQQAATIDVLKVMSASPGDPQPVFDLIVERACACCDAELAALTLLDGDLLRLNATSGMTAARTQEFATAYPLPVSQAFAGGRAILTRDTVQVPDTQADPGFAQRGTNAWHRSVLAVPLLRAGVPIGALGLGRSTPGAFPAAQVELLKTFAEQAVIAIGSAETYRVLQERTATLAERNRAFAEQVEYQSAIIDVLKVMSSSTSDTEPVFDIILQHAMQLCKCQFGGFQEFDGELVHLRATRGFARDALASYAREFPKVPTSADFANRAILSRQTVHIRNVDEEPGRPQSARGLAHKSNLAVPLLRDGAAIGAISLGHVDVDGFSDGHVELLKTFAEQAVIAIGSAATFRTLQNRTTDLQELLDTRQRPATC